VRYRQLMKLAVSEKPWTMAAGASLFLIAGCVQAVSAETGSVNGSIGSLHVVSPAGGHHSTAAFLPAVAGKSGSVGILNVQ
jgi:hypothetical protein